MTGAVPLEIDVDELARWRRTGIPHAVVDVREAWETELCLITGSLKVPLSTIPAAVAGLPREVPVVVVCHHGFRSMQGVTWLRRNGRENATNLSGGIDAWARRIEPAMAVY